MKVTDTPVWSGFELNSAVQTLLPVQDLKVPAYSEAYLMCIMPEH